MRRAPLAYRLVYAVEYREVYRPLLKFIERDGGSVVVDVGGGYGIASEMIAEHVDKLIMVEIEPEMAVKARDRLSKFGHVSVVVADACHLPLRDKVVDTVFFFDSLHHIRESECALREAARVLKPLGKLAIFDFDGSRLMTKLLSLVEKAFGLWSSFYPKGKLISMLEGMNFSIDYVEEGKLGELNLVATKLPQRR